MLLYRPHWSNRTPRKKKYELDRNESCDPLLKEILTEHFLKGLNADLMLRYPDVKKAYESISKFLNVGQDCVFFTSGSEQAIWSILHNYRGQFKRLVYPDPTFGIVEVYAKMYNYASNKIRYSFNNNQFTLPFRELLDADNQILYLASPDTPTGHVVEKENIERLCSQYEVVILDQAYNEFTGKDFIDIYRKFPNLFIVRTLSKGGAAAGLRIGYVVSQSQNIDRLYSERPMYEINSIACEFIEFYTQNRDIFSKSVIRLQKGKQTLEKMLREKGWNVIPCIGNFTIVEYSDDLFAKIDEMVAVKIFTFEDRKFIRITSSNEEVVHDFLG